MVDRRDFQKLIFYYYADHYINFKDLVTELYRIYKTRVWMSAVNPASFSQQAIGQPPSGLGPGALTMNNSYTMAYGPDPDPYGAVPPYRVVGQDPYNSEGYSGLGNTFTPGAPAFRPVTNATNPMPTAPPGVVQGVPRPQDYSFHYDTQTGQAPRPPMMLTPPAAPTAAPFAPVPGMPYNGMAMMLPGIANAYGGGQISNNQASQYARDARPGNNRFGLPVNYLDAMSASNYPAPMQAYPPPANNDYHRREQYPTPTHRPTPAVRPAPIGTRPTSSGNNARYNTGDYGDKNGSKNNTSYADDMSRER